MRHSRDQEEILERLREISDRQDELFKEAQKPGGLKWFLSTPLAGAIVGGIIAFIAALLLLQLGSNGAQVDTSQPVHSNTSISCPKVIQGWAEVTEKDTKNVFLALDSKDPAEINCQVNEHMKAIPGVTVKTNP